MDDKEILARTLYGESERNDKEDAKAIANVVMNRVANKRWPHTVSGVCKQKAQFSCWNADNKNLPKMLSADSRDPWYVFCYKTASQAVDMKLEDTTSGSTHYHANYVSPKWAKGKTPAHTTPWGKYSHLFYNDIDTPKPRTKVAAITTATVAATSAATSQVDASWLDHVGPLTDAARSVMSLGIPLGYLFGAVAVVGLGWLAYSWWQDHKTGGNT